MNFGCFNSIAFLEFKNKAIAEEMFKKKQKAQIKGRDLIVDRVRPRDAAKAGSKKTKGKFSRSKSISRRGAFLWLAWRFTDY